MNKKANAITNPRDFAQLPSLLSRAQVAACGVPDRKIDQLRFNLKSASDRVPFGMIGAIQLKAKGYFKYRKIDIAPILGDQFIWTMKTA